MEGVHAGTAGLCKRLFVNDFLGRLAAVGHGLHLYHYAAGGAAYTCSVNAVVFGLYGFAGFRAVNFVYSGRYFGNGCLAESAHLVGSAYRVSG